MMDLWTAKTVWDETVTNTVGEGASARATYSLVPRAGQAANWVQVATQEVTSNRPSHGH